VPATIAVEAERVAPGMILHRSASARLTVSNIGESRLASTVEHLQKFGFACQFGADEMKILWTKLAFLAPFALTTTASRMTIGEVIRDPVWRQKLEDGIREACAVSTATGTPLDASAFIELLDKISPNGRSSMQKDVAAGNPPELDAIAGPILRGAREHGLAAPVTHDLAALIQGKTALPN